MHLQAIFITYFLLNILLYSWTELFTMYLVNIPTLDNIKDDDNSLSYELVKIKFAS